MFGFGHDSIRTNYAVRFPNDSQRISILGKTGSGKSVGAMFHLSHRRFDLMPWVIYNYKRDETVDAIPYIKELPVDQLPMRPGVYVVHPRPDTDDEAVEMQMRAIWTRGNTGLYIDEGYMIPRNSQGYSWCLTQGRSKRIPMINLSQRPVWMNRFTFSESDFFQVFQLQHRKDRQLVEEYIPADLDSTLPEFHSWYYDTGRNRLTVFRPVPPLQVIYGTFSRRLGEMERRKRRVV